MRIVLTSACLPFLIAGIAAAQTADSEEQAAPSVRTLPEIRVSEQRGEVPLTTPASIDRLDGRAVDQGRIEHLGDIARQAPNVYLADMTRAAPHLVIRGMGFILQIRDQRRHSRHHGGRIR